MDKFKRVIKRRLGFMEVFNGLALAFVVLTSFYRNKSAFDSEYISGMIYGFQVGIFVGLQVLFLVFTVRYSRALKNDEALKKLYIAENDERAKLIKDKIGGVGFNFSIGAIATATIIAGFFHQVVFMTLLGALAFIVFVKGFLKIYYRNKF